MVARILAGDQAAESELVSRYGRGLTMVLARHARDPEVAEDLYQESLATALVKLRAGELREPSRLAAFLSSIARNLAIEHYRKLGRRDTEPDSETVDRTGDSRSESQLGGLLRRENAALVRQTVKSLANARDREILYRFYLADEDKSVIAAELGLESLQFNRVLHRARQRYRALWEETTAGRQRTRTAGAFVFLILLLGLAVSSQGTLFAPRGEANTHSPADDQEPRP